MSFTLEKINSNLLDTSVNNIFISEFMPQADGTFVKVYLLALRFAQDDDIEASNEKIAEVLKIPVIDVVSAWRFWKSVGIVDFDDDGDSLSFSVLFKDLRALYLSGSSLDKNSANNSLSQNTYDDELDIDEGDLSSDTKLIIEVNKDDGVKKMFQDVAHIVRRPLNTQEKIKIIKWLRDYNISCEMISHAYSYAYDILKKKSPAYVETIIMNWYDKGFTNLSQVMSDFNVMNDSQRNYNKLMQSLAMPFKNVSDFEKKIIDKWYDDFNYGNDIILKGAENFIYTAKPSIAYLDAILEAWHKEGIKTVEDAERTNELYRSDRKNNNTKKPKARVKDFDEREYPDDYLSDTYEGNWRK